MSWIIVTALATLVISAACSLFEAMILSTTVAEVESLKRTAPVRGHQLEKLRTELDETLAALLALNTIATTLGSVMVGALAARQFDNMSLGLIIGGLTLVMLVFSEVIPKNIGVAYRRALQPVVVIPLAALRRALSPVTFLSNLLVRVIIREAPTAHKSDEEIILLAERGAQQGTLTKSESNIIANALSLDDVRVSEIMTPRTVVTAMRRNATVGEVFHEYPNLPFGRMPVYGKNLDDIAGLVRRRDLLKAKANDQDFELVEKIMQEVHFIPETVTVANALQVFLKTHQQMLVVVDEFGSTSGVVTMEDVIEHLLGREIFEKDDMAVDMRELARSRLQKQARPRRPGEEQPPTPFPPPAKP
ncbi:MAG TPA: hemolysin family protein [Opitutaceae bacterium]|jgi:CBS domain containing-hemolysin-like protein|nr:hemolysin family protein [Opitutaceae bacterium]